VHPGVADTPLRQLARGAAALTLDDVPEPVRAQAVNQILSTLAAVCSGRESDLGLKLERAFRPSMAGPARIIPTGARASVSHAAMLMAAWSMVLDYDDVMLGGHTSHSSVLVPLAMGSAGRWNGAELLLAQIVANEVSARINMVCAIGNTRGQMATHVHLVAAAAARAKLERLDEKTFAEALSFALSYPAQALFPSFLGSDAKALCAAWPVRQGMESVDAVREGLCGAADVLDDPRGFFATMARVPVREFLGGFGERWHTATTSFKIYPVCGYLCSALDATLALVHEYDVAGVDVESVDVFASLFTIGMDAHSAPYLDGPRSRISTLTFSTPFAIASAILARDFTPAQLKRAWIDQQRVWNLAARVRSRHDLELTLEALTAEIPIGAALRRIPRSKAVAFALALAKKAFGKMPPLAQTMRLARKLASIAGDRSELHFRNATKPMGARVEIRMRDGRVLTRAVSIPHGFAGSDPKHVRELMRMKFMRNVSSAIGAMRARDTCLGIERIDRLSAHEVKSLLETACMAPVECVDRGDRRR
jgi:2-methylcitrate dehydratase PrpD